MTLADAALIGMQWIQEAQNGCVEQRDVAADSRRDCADDGVLPDSQPDGAMKRRVWCVDIDGRYRQFMVGPEFGLTDDEWRARGCPVGLRYQEEVAALFPKA